jgi:coenzyme F420 hydrogenase subunit beta
LRRRIRTITDVAERQLCTGCGACAFAQPEAITMVDDLDAGRRPVVRSVDGRLLPTVQAMQACPGVGLEHEESLDGIPSLRPKWGPVLEVWEGYAGDAEIRAAGSSGGVASALAIHGIEQAGMHGLLHIRSRADIPYLNETVLSTSRAEILAATGSRYAPASPCDRLDLIVSAPAPSVFIGKPCDVAATSKLRAFQAELDEKLGLTVAIFCAGTPTTRGTFELLRAMGVDRPEDLVSIRYRGNGWPGDAVATFEGPDGDTWTERLTYSESWGEVLQRHRQWRCYVCADHTGEFADIAVGDPWYRPIDEGDPGRSLILVRTERGRSMLRAALEAGAVIAEQVPAHRLPASQPGLLRVRGSVGGRIATLRLLGLPSPRFRRLPMFGTWWRELSLRGKLRSTLGTLRRVRRRGLYRRIRVRPFESAGRTRADGDTAER